MTLIDIIAAALESGALTSITIMASSEQDARDRLDQLSRHVDGYETPVAIRANGGYAWFSGYLYAKIGERHLDITVSTQHVKVEADEPKRSAAGL